MENLHTLSKNELIDLLADQAALYSKMHLEGGSQEDFQKCLLLIRAIQTEVESRNKEITNTPDYSGQES